jgi:YD repeat-containing protein
MKTGRLLKFRRPGGEIHAYLYKEEGQYRAAVYLLSAEHDRDGSPLQTVSGSVESAVERDVRAWVDAHFPAAR